ncbi:hypothetical protein RRG08_044489 [Elysia crispata]|uniref:Uncharacterized protein n=1 Tax=Elysia crispata TaxID=231223 RepID=A0AAE1D791_9GAST|nr:hypothetical protein RRG08_044489 [Elysia crispata]
MTTRQQPQHSVKTSHNIHPEPTPSNNWTTAAAFRKDITKHSSWLYPTTRQQPQHFVKTSDNIHPDPTPPLDSSRSSVKTSHNIHPDPTPSDRLTAAAAPREDITQHSS